LFSDGTSAPLRGLIMSKFNFFEEVTVSTTSFENHMVSWNFVSSGFLLMVDSTDVNDIILYSFDGITVHGNLSPTKPNEGLAFDQRHESRVYFARRSGSGAVLVRVEAWA